MKKFLVLSALVITSCTLSNEEKAEKLVKETLKDYLYHPDSYEPISTKVDDLNKSIEELDDIQMITNNISETIKEAVGTTYSPSSLSIKSNLPSEAEKLLQSLKLFIGEPGEVL